MDDIERRGKRDREGERWMKEEVLLSLCGEFLKDWTEAILVIQLLVISRSQVLY